MADTQTGYVGIHNGLFEAIIAGGFSGGEYAVLLAIIRKTDGWQKDCDAISNSQLMKQTGIKSRTHLLRILHSLETQHIVTATHNHGSATVFALNKDYDTWTCPRVSTCPTPETCAITGTGHVPNQRQDMSLSGDMDMSYTGDIQHTSTASTKTTTNNQAVVVSDSNESGEGKATETLLQQLEHLVPGRGKEWLAQSLTPWQADYKEAEIAAAIQIALDRTPRPGNPLAFVRTTLDNRRNPKQGGSYASRKTKLGNGL